MVAVMRLPVGPDPGILPGQALELYVASCCVPARDVGGEVGLTEGEFELGDIGTHFLPGAIGCEVAADNVLEALPHVPLVGVVPVVVGPLAAYAAAQPHLTRHLQDRLIGEGIPPGQLGHIFERFYRGVPPAVGTTAGPVSV